MSLKLPSLYRHDAGQSRFSARTTSWTMLLLRTTLLLVMLILPSARCTTISTSTTQPVFCAFGLAQGGRTTRRRRMGGPASSSVAASTTTTRAIIQQSERSCITKSSQGTSHRAPSFTRNQMMLISDDLNLNLDIQQIRQYVPLVVIGFVLLDIVLGSPFANSILAKARPPTPEEEADAAMTASNTKSKSFRKNQKERIDVDSYAKAAIERAQGVTELRDYLERSKTDWDRMEEIRRKMDAKLEQIDDTLAEIQQQNEQQKSKQNQNQKE